MMGQLLITAICSHDFIDISTLSIVPGRIAINLLLCAMMATSRFRNSFRSSSQYLGHGLSPHSCGNPFTIGTSSIFS